MLTDKQIFLCCGLLSLIFHLCAWRVWNNNSHSWNRPVKPSISTIQVSLITGNMTVVETASEIIVQGKSQVAVVKRSSLIVASLETRLKIVPRPVAKLSLTNRPILEEEPVKQQQQKIAETFLSKKSVAITPIAKPLPSSEGTKDNLEEQDSCVERYHRGEGVAAYNAEQALPAAVLGSRDEEESVVEASRQGIEPAYLTNIRQMIEKHLDYPARARRLHLTGEVNLNFNITAAGDVDKILILGESSYPILNKAAIRAVKQAAPFPQPQRKINVGLPILFSLN